MDTILHATPYGHYNNFAGFFFKSVEEYQEKYDRNFKVHGCEEYEIQFIDGPYCDLFRHMSVSQNTLAEYFDIVEGTDNNDIPAIAYLLSIGRDIDEARKHASLLCLTTDSAIDYVYDLVQDCYDLPEIAERYFDYEAFKGDLEIEGSICTFEYDGTMYLITNALDF